MKRLLPIICLVTFLASCRSIDKLVEQGRYDEAIYLAVEKLAGKKKKKTKHIIALEEAFGKVNHRDLSQIEFLKSQNRPENWDKIYSIYGSIRTRQNRIMPFLPLISKDGYEANFRFSKVNDRMKTAADQAALYHYKHASDLIIRAESGDKYAARNAYNSLHDVERYYLNYKDKSTLKSKALDLGVTRVLVNIVNSAHAILPPSFERVLRSVKVSDLNSRWEKYYVNEVAGLRYDLYADLQILDISISPSRELRDRWEVDKEVENGWYYKTDRAGSCILDTLGKRIKVKKYKQVSALITQTTREKEVRITGNLVYRNVKTNIREESRPIDVQANFLDESYVYVGDRLALPKEIKNRLSAPLPFPSDYDLTMEVAEYLKGILKSELVRTTR